MVRGQDGRAIPAFGHTPQSEVTPLPGLLFQIARGALLDGLFCQMKKPTGLGAQPFDKPRIRIGRAAAEPVVYVRNLELQMKSVRNAAGGMDQRHRIGSTRASDEN